MTVSPREPARDPLQTNLPSSGKGNGPLSEDGRSMTRTFQYLTALSPEKPLCYTGPASRAYLYTPTSTGPGCPA